MYRRSLFHRFCILVSIAPSIFINGDAGVLSDLSSIKLKSLQHSSQQKTDFTLFPDNMRMSSKLIATCPIANNHEIASTTAERYMKSARIQAPSSWAQYRVNSKMNRKEYLTASNHFMTSLPVHVSLLGLFFSFRPTVLTVSGAFHAAFLGFSVWGLMGQKVYCYYCPVFDMYYKYFFYKSCVYVLGMVPMFLIFCFGISSNKSQISRKRGFFFNLILSVLI